MVVVAGPAGAPAVIQRKLLKLADPAIHGSVQPYHAAAGLDPGEAAAFLRRCAVSTDAMAQRAMRETVDELSRQGRRAAGCCVLEASGRPLPDLAAILAAHPLIHTAEGVFFRQTIKDAAAACGLPVTGIRENQLLEKAAASLRMSTVELLRRATEMGKKAGPPWRKDDKLAAIAAWLVLAV